MTDSGRQEKNASAFFELQEAAVRRLAYASLLLVEVLRNLSDFRREEQA